MSPGISKTPARRSAQAHEDSPSRIAARVRESRHARPLTGMHLPTGKPVDLIQAVQRGLPFRILEALSAKIGMALPELASLVRIPVRTLGRRKVAGKLSFEESERVLRLARVLDKAVALFEGDTAQAREWLRLPKKALDGASPLDYSVTEIGAREVENLIGRMEYGVFS